MSAGRQPPIAPARLRADRDLPVALVELGTVGYRDAWDLQRRLVARRQLGEGSDALLLLEHPPVYTYGRRADPRHLLLDDGEREQRGIDLLEVDRGGDITYHGPGQLVGYPILRLSSVRGVIGYVRALEEVLIRALDGLGVAASRIEGVTGVWVGDAKIAAIGVRVASGGVTSHGFALNVDPRLDDFSGIVPCGIADRGVCSLASLGVPAGIDEVASRVGEAFGAVFGATLRPATRDELDGPALATTGAPVSGAAHEVDG